MTKETHKITITFSVGVDLRTNGDGFEYETVKEQLKMLIRHSLLMTSRVLIPKVGTINMDDETLESSIVEQDTEMVA